MIGVNYAWALGIRSWYLCIEWMCKNTTVVRDSRRQGFFAFVIRRRAVRGGLETGTRRIGVYMGGTSNLR